MYRRLMFRGRNPRRRSHLHVAAEVSHKDLQLVVIDRQSAQPVVRSYSITWRQQFSRTAHPGTIRELAGVLQALATRERLQGAAVRVALSGDFCITRVNTGTKEEIRRQLRTLQDRCPSYLSLGAGDNVLTKVTRSLDAKHEVVWVSVANRGTLRSIIQAFELAGLTVQSLQHSLVLLARVVGKLGCDQDEPVLLLDVTERGVDVGISYQGQLLLDYRPGGMAAKEQVAAIIARHLKRLQRFCNRRFRFAAGKLRKVYLCGQQHDVHLILPQFAAHTNLSVEILTPQQLLCSLGYTLQGELQSEHAACVGMLLPQVTSEALSPVPDFMDELTSRAEQPLWPSVARLCWPVAATFAIAAVVFGAACYQRLRANQLQQTWQSYEQTQQRYRQLHTELTLARLQVENLDQIRQKILRPDWPELLAALGRSLPRGVWLERVVLDGDGQLHIFGPSHSEDGVFEFVKALKRDPMFLDVALEGTQPATFLEIPGLRFEISGQLARSISQTGANRSTSISGKRTTEVKNVNIGVSTP